MDNYDFFISQDFSKFVGEWVALNNKKIIAHGKDFKKVYFEAKKKLKGKRPFISKIRSSAKTIL